MAALMKNEAKPVVRVDRSRRGGTAPLEIGLWVLTLGSAATLWWACSGGKWEPSPGLLLAVRGSSFDTPPTPVSENGPTEESAEPEIETRDGVPVIDFAWLAFPGYDPPELRGDNPQPVPPDQYPAAVVPYHDRPVVLEGFPLVLGMQSRQIRSFLLTRFAPGCCFGAVPVLDEWVEVQLEEGLGEFLSQYATVTVKGHLQIGEELDQDGLVKSLYRMGSAVVVEP